MKAFLYYCVAILCIAASNHVADASTTQIGLNAMIVNGLPRESRGTSSIAAQPAPMLWISHRIGRFTLFGEGTTSLGPASVSTDLSVMY